MNRSKKKSDPPPRMIRVDFRCARAMQRRNGSFGITVATPRVLQAFLRSRTPLPRNVRFHASRGAPSARPFRPCKRLQAEQAR